MTLNIRVTDDQLGVFYRKMAAIADRLGKSLSFDDVIAALQRVHDGQFFVEQGMQATPDSKPVLLVPVKTLEVPAIDHFVVANVFKEKGAQGFQLYWMNEAFKRNFVPKIEQSVSAETLRKLRLTKRSLDKSILDELRDRAVTTLAHLFELLKKQPRGESGDLLVNGSANIFYVEDMSGIVWAVVAFWLSGRGWYVSAYSVSSRFSWYPDRAVFSR